VFDPQREGAGVCADGVQSASVCAFGCGSNETSLPPARRIRGVESQSVAFQTAADFVQRPANVFHLFGQLVYTSLQLVLTAVFVVVLCFAMLRFTMLRFTMLRFGMLAAMAVAISRLVQLTLKVRPQLAGSLAQFVSLILEPGSLQVFGCFVNLTQSNVQMLAPGIDRGATFPRSAMLTGKAFNLCLKFTLDAFCFIGSAIAGKLLNLPFHVLNTATEFFAFFSDVSLVLGTFTLLSDFTLTSSPAVVGTFFSFTALAIVVAFFSLAFFTIRSFTDFVTIASILVLSID
jgi:hypothetical protein